MAVQDSNTTLHIVSDVEVGSNGLVIQKRLFAIESSFAGSVLRPMSDGEPILVGTKYAFVVIAQNANTTQQRRVEGTDFLDPNFFSFVQPSTIPLPVPPSRVGAVPYDSGANTISFANELLRVTPNQDLEDRIFYYWEVIVRDAPVGTIAENTANIVDDLSNDNYETNTTQNPIVAVEGVYGIDISKTIRPVGRPVEPYENGFVVANKGDQVLFKVRLTENELGEVPQFIAIKDVLDSNLQFDSFETPSNNITQLQENNGEITWVVEMDGANNKVGFFCTVKQTAIVGQAIPNQARTEDEFVSGVPYNQSQIVFVIVTDDSNPPEKVIMNKNTTQATAERGETFLYNITFFPTDLVNGFQGQIEDNFPNGIEYLFISNPPGQFSNINYDSGANKLTFDLDMTNGETSVQTVMTCRVKNDAPVGLTLNQLVHDPQGVNDRSNQAPLTILPATEGPTVKMIRSQILGLLDKNGPIIPSGLAVLKLDTYVVEVLIVNPISGSKTVEFEDVLNENWEFDGLLPQGEPRGNIYEWTDLDYDSQTKTVSKTIILPAATEVAPGVNLSSITRVLFKVKIKGTALPLQTATNTATIDGVPTNETSHLITI